MDEVLTSAEFLNRLCANSAALARAGLPPLPEFRDGPEGLECVPARDGRRTFRWRQDGTWRWLGRTSMPSIRGPALIESFQHGGANVLLAGAGSGAEIECLLRVTARFQAVIVVEEAAWQIALILRLYDFSADLAAGRLLIFAGPQAWHDCRDFLIRRDGYLPPERVLAWPWFTPEHVAHVQQQAAWLHREMATGRATRDAVVGPIAAPAEPRPQGAVLFVTNIPEPERLRLMDAWQAAARCAGRPSCAYALTDPARMSPDAVERELSRHDPALAILLDVVPRELHHAVPAPLTLILMTSGGGLPESVCAPWPDHAWLGVLSQRQRRQAIERGIPGDRILHLPPAATFAGGQCAAERGDRVALVADAGDDSPESAGLHLSSHRQLWEAARSHLSDKNVLRCGDISEEALQTAERKMGIRVESEPVRRGLRERMQLRLLPVARRRSCVAALARNEAQVDAIGHGWSNAAALRARPSIDGALPAADGQYGLCVFPDLSGRRALRLLDAAAAGALCAVPAGEWKRAESGIEDVLSPGEHVMLFETPSELAELGREFRGGSPRLREIARRAAAHIWAGHTLEHRFAFILSALAPRQEG